MPSRGAITFDKTRHSSKVWPFARFDLLVNPLGIDLAAGDMTVGSGPSQQVHALRSATAEAKPWIDKMGPVLSGASTIVGRLSRSSAYNLTISAQDAYSTNINKSFPKGQQPNLALRDNLIAAASSDDKLIAATTPDVFSAMIKAHDTLADQLAGRGTLTLPHVSASIQNFATQV